ncbi:oxysterol-binding protein-related protein 1-like [Sinocyclocheilus grahami]|uniref:oxysterol-binding protein-related protein 1-like n=1 Tax=Sinocyclocheilus grahami TaxID=75366 RepID=UPI0007ACA64D|nr:PREDICTED: oxysterol-binding protein-related protein 1-like [Sinocyclocheilus grahami]
MSGDGSQGDKTQCNGEKNHRYTFGFMGFVFPFCVAAFAVSAVASQWERTGKPFNPLLGETYELLREDLGFRWVSEQVSHHPPVSAFHAEGIKSDFRFHGSIYPKLKFWGKSVEAEPRGIITLELPLHNEAYTWTNPTCCVHNIIMGQLWIEQYGNVEIINHKTGERCCLTFKPCGIFGKELHKVEGYILDKRYVDITKMTNVISVPGTQITCCALLATFYAFTTFALQLNVLDAEMERVLPQTDCRLRPDIRALENGDIGTSIAYCVL